jgi:hypothetical protein
MVRTGTISFITESGGGYDINGNPTASTKVNSAYYPCNLSVITRQYITLADGQVLQAKYSIVIDNFLIAGIDLTSLKEVQLQDSKHNLGKFQVQNIEYLDLTQRLKIVV